MRRRRWSELTQSQQRLVAVGAVLQVVLQVAALRDLRQRPPDQVRGSRRLWAGATFVNVGGPCAYFLFGRRRAP